MGTEKATEVGDSGNRNEGVKTYSREKNGGQSEKCGESSEMEKTLGRDGLREISREFMWLRLRKRKRATKKGMEC